MASKLTIRAHAGQRSRYVGDGKWEPVENPEPVLYCAGSTEESITQEWFRETYKNHFQDNAFVRAHMNGWDSCTYRPGGTSTSDLGSIEDLKKRMRDLKMRAKVFNDPRDLELHKNSEGIYQL